MSTTNGRIIPMKVKLVFGTDIRQWRYPPSNKWESLLAFIRTSFHIQDFTLQYNDDEWDKITIDSESTLIDAYNSRKDLRRSLRIFVTEKHSTNTASTPTAESLFADDDDQIEFHWGSTCSKCKASPIQGVRYKCCICTNYNLCANCESIKNVHDASHPMIKLNVYKNKFSRFGVSANSTTFKGLNELFHNLGLSIQSSTKQAVPSSNGQTPSQKPINRRFENGKVCKIVSKLSAELIKDLTLKEGTECICDNIQTKKWRMRNNGSQEWGYNVELVYCDGNDAMILNKRVTLSNCQPMKNIDISMQIKVPSQTGKYSAYYQLQSNGKSFGPKLCVSIISINQKNTTSQTSDEIVFNGHSKQSKGRRLSMVLSKNITSISCICGEYLMATKPNIAYRNGQIVFCADCGARCGQRDTIYHCSMDANSSLHPNGYDLCKSCYELQINSAFDTNKSDNVKPMNPKPIKQVVTLSDIQKYAKKIDELRNVFPRFYFLSNDDMIRLIKDPSPCNVNNYVSILFEGVCSFAFDDDDKHIILGLIASNGELLKFGRCINCGNKSLNGLMDKWLLKVEYQMKYSLSMQLEQSFVEYKNLQNSEKYFLWISTYNVQILLLTKKCLWCKTIEFFLKLHQQNDKNPARLNECLREIKAEIHLLSDYVRKLIKEKDDKNKNMKLIKSKIGALISELIYQRNVTESLIKQNVKNINDRIWKSKVRTYYASDDNMLDKFNIFKKLRIKCNDNTYYYGYEYFGNVNFLYSRTIDCDDVFPLFLSNYDQNLMSNVFGEIGTGKKESIRTFAFDLGRPCKTFNEHSAEVSDLSHMTDSDRLLYWFAGICGCGGFGILNASDIEKFGIGQISYYAMSVYYKLNEEASNHFFINDKRMTLHSNTRLFVVSKKKYIHHFNKEIAMSKIIKAINISSSNKISIAHTLLLANGYKECAKMFAPKIAMLLEHCITLLVSESCYDFGFRLILKIAQKAGDALVEFVQNNEDIMNEEDENEENVFIDDDDFENDDDALNNVLKKSENKMMSKKDEEKLLIHSLIVVMFEMLSKSDCILFESIFQSAFPQSNVDWNKYSKSSMNELSSHNIVSGNDDFIYQNELAHLQLMGFSNVRQCKQALIKYDGNAEIVMKELFKSVKAQY